MSSGRVEDEPVSPAYILKVQNMIERCLLLHMDCTVCVNALSTYGNVNPIVSRTVWNELKKENKSFFAAYERYLASGRHGRALMEERRKLVAGIKDEMKAESSC